ncbi:hypothetical protein CsatB_025187 [Cannabis sativa]
MMRKELVVLVRVLGIVNLLLLLLCTVDGIEGCRVLNLNYVKQNNVKHNNILMSSLERGGNTPPAPNPTKPGATLNHRNFAGSSRRHPPHLPHSAT